MPNSASAKKDLRQNHARRLRNRTVRSALRTQIGRVRKAVKGGDVATAEKELAATVRKLDQMGSRHIVHKNTANRLKSRLVRLVKGIAGTPA